MSAQIGIVVDLVDPGSGATIGKEILHDISAISPAPRHLLLRSAVNAGPGNVINTAAYIRALQAVKDAGFQPPWMVLQGGTEEGYQSLKGAAYRAAMPNAVLGYQGNPLLNPYIDAFADKAVAFMQALPDALLPSTWFLWNEGNEDSSTLRPGQIPQKGMALAPEVFGALLATVSSRIKAAFPHVRLIPGALSCLSKFFTKVDSVWVGGYVGIALDYIKAHGVNPPYHFGSFSLNLEGILEDAWVASTAHEMTQVMRRYGLTGQTICAEAGEHNENLADVDWSPTFASLVTHMSYVFLYTYGTNDPALYGVRTVGINPAGFLYPKEKTSFYDKFRDMLTAHHAGGV